MTTIKVKNLKPGQLITYPTATFIDLVISTAPILFKSYRLTVFTTGPGGDLRSRVYHFIKSGDEEIFKI